MVNIHMTFTSIYLYAVLNHEYFFFIEIDIDTFELHKFIALFYRSISQYIHC